MTEPLEYRRYRDEVAVLIEIGRHLASLVPFVDVAIPARLADAAIAAWNRDEDGQPIEESDEQRRLRGDAANLALLGLVLCERGQRTGNEVTVSLPITYFTAAVATANNEAS